VRRIFFACFLIAVTHALAGDLKVVWQLNTEPDLAGYFVYYGTKSRPRGNRLEVGRQTQYVIQNLKAGETYYIAVTAVDSAGNESVFSEQMAVRVLADKEKRGGLPPQHFLLSIHPNPFHLTPNKTTTFAFELYEPSSVKLEIFNVLGQRVVTRIDKNLQAGAQTFVWDGRNSQNQFVQTGVYLYRLETARQISTRKVMVYR